MNIQRPSVILATLDWHYVIEEDRLNLGWDLYDTATEERVVIGSAPARHLVELEDEATRACSRLCASTRSYVRALHSPLA